ncbi:hypothetical protein RKE29_06345 [Streptomyces sp. B1866]|uniref:hypothetical protein n=1 Tax=Streptomyces sp. B1866 TaxID=3075431 RepID=UPI00288EFAE7|nr:hypothetical protein [Streptomyces sp. B1866]MDT3396260.1 hypothetical protein [Streptomyces sp. B1866]
MFAAPAQPAAVRPWRAAVARRALLAALFLGGVLALAFFFGGSAYAASEGAVGGGPGGTGPVRVPGPADPGGMSAPDDGAAAHGGHGPAAAHRGEAAAAAHGPAADDRSAHSADDRSAADGAPAAGPADDHSGVSGSDGAAEVRRRIEAYAADTQARAAETSREVRETVQRVVRPLEDSAGRILDPVGDVVQPPADGGGLPVRLPGTSIVIPLPGLQLPAVPLPAITLPAPGGSGAAGHVTAADAPGHRAGAARLSGPAGADRRAAATPTRAVAPMGPKAPGHGGLSGADRDAASHRHTRAAFGGPGRGGFPLPLLPLPEAPLGATSQCTGDSGTPRGGDTHAALPPEGTARFGLRPGAIRADSAAPTRERFSEVLEFPG